MTWKTASVAENLARNLVALRQKKNLSQQALADLSDIPRSTITHIESGAGNPSLAKLSALSGALGVGVEELLSRPRGECKLVKSEDVRVVTRSHGSVQIAKLLPERIKGIEIDRMEIEPRASMTGTPHVAGTKEYLHCLSGEVTVLVAGDVYAVSAGDVLAFPGDQRHSYRNRARKKAVAISVVLPIPAMVA